MRVDALRERLAGFGIDGMLVTKMQNRMYLSGFTGSAGALVIGREGQCLVTDFRYAEQAGMQAKGFSVVIHGAGGFHKTVMEEARRLGVTRLGFEAQDLSVDEFSGYEAEAAGLTLVATKGVVEKMRSVKDAAELEKLRHVCRLTDRLFDHILGILKPGMAERSLAAEIDIWMIRNGMSPSFGTIVASGARGALPHGRASEKPIEEGDLVTMDFGGYFDYYTSDMTRTVCVGKADSKQKEIYDIVLDAQMAGVDAAQAGLKGREVDSVARKMIESKGYGQYFGHGLGHGVGLEVHEEPRFSVTDENTMEPGMVLSVEPGIYVPGWGGVRIEDLVVITDKQAEVLYKAPKNLIEL